MRTHWCGELRAQHAGETVRLAGWVHSRRDHGGVIFLDIRDRSGLVQVVAASVVEGENEGAYLVAGKVRSEYVVLIEGTVQRRPDGTVNANIPTGEIEVAALSVEVLTEAETPPFPIEDRIEASEETRIKYRYLDLRRPEIQSLMILRHRVVTAIRSHFNEEGFIEIETPMLTKATPEGARDFIVPSRAQPGKFWALPQSPQLFKQLLMVAGFDRYYQIARCFRDEDPRSDRHIDFTQLDMEMSFVDEEAIFDQTERMLYRIWKEILGLELKLPFLRLSYDESFARYGTDKPDLRFGLELTDVTNVFTGTQIRIFRTGLDSGGVVKAIRVKGQAEASRKDLDRLNVVAKNLGAGGLAWIGFSKDGINSPLKSVLSEDEIAGLRKSMESTPGDLILLVCDRQTTAEVALGAVRVEVAQWLSLVPDLPPEDPGAWKFVWTLEPPLVEYNDKESRWDPVHHPFTAPRIQDEAILESDPGAVRARAYDIALNGWEIGGGSIRIHRPELQRRVFDLIGLPKDEAERRFGWFLKAFSYGAPPHGGIAPGIDRIVAKLAQKDNIREVIAFPKTGAYTDVMTEAPDEVDPRVLKELGIRTIGEA